MTDKENVAQNETDDDGTETTDSEDDVRLKGNVNILDETREKYKLNDRPRINELEYDDDLLKPKGNITIMNDTIVGPEYKQSCEDNRDTDGNDTSECSEYGDESLSHMVQACKENITADKRPKDQTDLDSAADSDDSLEKGNETVTEASHLDRKGINTYTMTTSNLSLNVKNDKVKSILKTGDSRTKIKTAIKSLKTTLEILEKNDYTLKAPLVHCVAHSNSGSTIQAEASEHVPFREKQDKVREISSDKSPSTFCSCNFCNTAAVFTCKSCKYFYCTTCRSMLHPDRGPFVKHKVIPIICDDDIEHYEICKDHDLVSQLFCSYCDQTRCAECANTKCLLHFKGRVSRADIEKEKTLLVEEMERATAKLSFVGRYKDFAENECDKIELSGLLKKEQIRQEFASLHDLLVEKEVEMLEVLDRDVEERMNHVRDTLQASVLHLEREDALLTTTVTDLVQTEDDGQFIEECVKAKELCSQIDEKISKFNRNWAKNSKYSRSQVLDSPFSMLQEKKQLLQKLDSAVSFVPEVKFTQTTMYVHADSGPLLISDFLCIPATPTSTEAQYHLQVSTTHRKVIYQAEIRDLTVVCLNTEETVKFKDGYRYLVKINPCYKYTVDTFEQSLESGKPAHMLIVVSRNIKRVKKDTRKFEFDILPNERVRRIKRVTRKVRR